MDRRTHSVSLAGQINANGFRQWHEYELTRSFGYLGLGVLSMVAGLAFIDGAMALENLLERALKILLSFAGLCLTGWAWIQFILILSVAESISRQAVCAQCHRYGRIDVIDERSSEDLSMKVMTCKCKKCAYIWKINYTLQWRDARI